LEHDQFLLRQGAGGIALLFGLGQFAEDGEMVGGNRLCPAGQPQFEPGQTDLPPYRPGGQFCAPGLALVQLGQSGLTQVEGLRAGDSWRMPSRYSSISGVFS
jgi:hypothetical protein